MTPDDQDLGTRHRVSVWRRATRALLVLLAGYLLIVELAAWTYLTYKGTKAPDTYGEPMANAVVGLLPVVIAGTVAWTTRRRGRDAWGVLRATALTAIPACLVAALLSSGPGV